MTNGATLGDCTIVWLCPLEVELRAAITMLDKVYEDIPPRAKGQNVVYTIGEIGGHKVAVVGYYQEQGLAVSGSMVAEVMRDLPNLEMGLLVGIAGGIPSSTRNIRLGDVTVAVPEGDRPGVVGYDLGKAGENNNFELKHWQNATHPLLRSVINIIRARNEFGFRQHLSILEERPEFRRPDSPALSREWSLDEQTHISPHPAVHYGTILSGNSVIKSKARRDYLGGKYGGIAVEMEAAGIMTRLPVAVIRGISDFADSSKNDAWQPYAAITAAAYAKEVLNKLPSSRGSRLNPLSSPFANQDFRLVQTLPEKWAFVGREVEIAYLEQELGFQAEPPLQKSVVGLWGLSGVGKSQLASRFVSQQRSRHPEREIFWVNGESREEFEQGVINMLNVGGDSVSLENAHPGKNCREQRMALVDSFFVELNRVDDPRWLLIVDGINIRPNSNPSDSAPFDIHSFIGRLRRGYVLLIARRRDMVERYHPNCELKGLKDEEATSLLQSQVDRQLTEGGIEELARLLKGLPLALRLAVSAISRYRYTTANYLEMWKNRGVDGEFLGVDETLSRSMALSFEELEIADPVAAKILTLFSFLDHKDLWYDLCLSAVEDTYPVWLRELAKQQKSFRNYYPMLADLSFIELNVSAKGHQTWETHPAIQVVARQRAIVSEEEYIRCAISLVTSQVPRSYEENFWEKTRRLEPHADQCWSYIRRGKWGPNTNLTELESLGRLFRHVGRYQLASVIYRMIENGLNMQTPTIPKAELLADIFTNLGLAYTGQQKFDLALQTFQKSWALRSELGTLTPDISMSIMYNKAVVFMMTGRLDEAEDNLRKAATYFARSQTDQQGLMKNERKRLYIRILNDIGEVLLRKGSAAAATDAFYHILDSQRGALGESHPTIISIKLNLGRAHTKLSQFTTAHALLKEVIAIYTEWWGRSHPDTMRAVEEMALALLGEGKQRKAAGLSASSEIQNAEALWNEALGFYKSIHGNDSEMVSRVTSNL